MSVNVYKNGKLNRLAGIASGISEMVGATDKKNGRNGTVPAPLIADKDKFLKGDGTWSEVNLASKADNIYYDEDNSELQLKSGDTVLSTVTIEGGGGGIPLSEPTNVSVVNVDEGATIKWTDPEDISVSGAVVAKWAGTLIVRKVGSAPTSKTDGVVVLDSKVKNNYSSNGFTDVGLVNGTKYYYGVFPYTETKVYTTTKVIEITPTAIYPTAPSDVSVSGGNALATLSFSLPSDASTAKIVYGTHSPTSPSDGTVIETTTSPYVIDGLENDTEYFFAVYSFNAKGRYTVSNIVKTTPKALEIVSWANGTDAQITAMLEAHYAGDIDVSTIWAVGDIRKVSLSSMAATGVGESHATQEVELVIIDFKHDDLANGGKAAVTVQQRDSLSEYGYMNSSNTNANGWDRCARRTWCNNVYKKALPTALASLIKTVAKKTSAGSQSSTIKTSNDDVFMVSEVEVFGQTTYSFAGEGEQYEYYKTTANRVKYQGTARATAYYWWERSPRSSNSTSFCYVNSSGAAYGYNASNAYGLAPAFCI